MLGQNEKQQMNKFDCEEKQRERLNFSVGFGNVTTGQ